MANKKNINLVLTTVLLVQLVIAMFACNISSAILTTDQLSQRISDAVETTGDIWWYSPTDREKVISLLKPSTRDLKDKTFNPCFPESKTFNVEGYHFLIKPDFIDGASQFRKNTSINTQAVVQAIYSAGHTEDVPSAKNAVYYVPVGGTATSGSFQYDAITNPYYTYSDQSIASKFYGPIVKTFEPSDRMGFKFQVDTSKLAVGKFQVVIKAQSTVQDDDQSWVTSAIIPFSVERENILKLTKIQNDHDSTSTSSYGDADAVNPSLATPTWSVYKRAYNDSITISGYCLNGKLDSNKQPISIQEIRLSMNFVNDVSVSTRVYNGRDPDNRFVPVSPAVSFADTSAVYTNTYSDIYQDNQRYNVGFMSTLKLTSAQLSEFNKKLMVGGPNKITLAFYAYEPGNPQGRLFSTQYQDINVKIPDVDLTLQQPNGSLKFDAPLADPVRPILDESSIQDAIYKNVSGQVYYNLKLTGDYKLVGKTKIAKVSAFVPGNGDLFPKAISYVSNGYVDSDSVDNINYKITFTNAAYRLNIDTLKAGMHSASDIETIPVRVIITDDLGKQHSLDKTLYFKNMTPAAILNEPSDTIIVAYTPINPRTASPSQPKEFYADVTQTIREIDCANNGVLSSSTTISTYFRVEGLVLAGHSMAKKNAQGNFRLQNVQVASSIYMTPITATITEISKNSSEAFTNPSDSNAVFVDAYYKAYSNGVSNVIYKFSADIPVDFNSIKSSSQKIFIRTTLKDFSVKDPSGKAVVSSATRPIYISKLGEGKVKNTIRTVDVPTKNVTIQVPTVSRYNTDSLVTIPVSGTILDGNYSGVKSVELYFDNTLMKTITSVASSGTDRIEEISDSDLHNIYKDGYTRKFSANTNAPLPPDGLLGTTKDRLNIKFYGTIQIKNSDKALSKPKHNIIARATTYDGRAFSVVQPMKISRFKELHSPIVKAMAVGAIPCVALSVYDSDLDVNTATYKWTYETQTISTGTLTRSVGAATIEAFLPIPASSVAGATYTLSITATDKTKRIATFSKSFNASNPVAAAYSLRKLNMRYNGPAIQVKSTVSGATYQDIYFNPDGSLDTNTLLTYANKQTVYQNVYVYKWYDQSGNGVAANIYLATDPLKIVDSGTLVTANNKPTINWSSYHSQFLTPQITAKYCAAVINPTVKNSDANRILGGYPSVNNQIITFTQASDSNWGQVNASGTKYVNNDSINNKIYIDTLSLVHVDLTNPITQVFSIGNKGQNGGYHFPGNISEFIFYTNSLSATDRTALYNDQKAYYSSSASYDAIAGGTGLATAYSLRKVNPYYSGKCIQVRRSSDNATKDIGFNSSGLLDTDTFAAFAGSDSDVYIKTWYDQSGNGRNAAQATASAQPKIVSNGKVVMQNGKTSIAYNSSSANTLTTSSFDITNIISNQKTSIFAAFKSNSVKNFGTLLGMSIDLENRVAFFTYFSGSANVVMLDAGSVGSARVSLTSASYLKTFQTGSFLRNDGNAYIRKNGTLLAQKTDCKYTPSGSKWLTLGGSDFDGYISEIIIYNNAIDYNAIETNQGSYYNTP